MSASSKSPTMRETSTDYTHPYRPRPVAAINRLAGLLGSDGGRLDAHAMVRAAEKQTGLTDFALKSSVQELMDNFASLGDATVRRLEVKHGLPFRMQVEEAAA